VLGLLFGTLKMIAQGEKEKQPVEARVGKE
jgi:hypothetical protein